MTPVVTKTMSSRPGKGVPFSSATGTDSAMASETAPRKPATALTTTTVTAIPELADEHGISDEVRDRVSRDYAEHLSIVEASHSERRAAGSEARMSDAAPDPGAEPAVLPDRVAIADPSPLARDEEYRRLRLALLDRKREVLIRLRHEGTIDDSVARRVQTRLDVEELRLTGVEPLD